MEEIHATAINYTPINVADYQTSNSAQEPKKRRLNIMNLALLFLTCTSLLGFAYAVLTSQTTVNTNATYSQKPDQNIMAGMKGMEVGDYKFPKTFKGTRIPDSLYQSAKVKDANGQAFINDYIKDQVTKFYSYKYTLDENGIESSASANITDFSPLIHAVSDLEQTLLKNLVTTYDFSYIIAHFSSNSSESKDTAKKLITSYKTKLQDSEKPESIVEEANNDAALTALNVSDKSQDIKNYEITTSIFPADNNFNTYLITQQEKKVAEPYVLKDQHGVEVGYVVVKVNTIHQKKYRSLKQIIAEQERSFGY